MKTTKNVRIAAGGEMMPNLIGQIKGWTIKATFFVRIAVEPPLSIRSRMILKQSLIPDENNEKETQVMRHPRRFIYCA
jgi:hypothetical protein